MVAITNILAREILDSRGHPTIEVTVETENFSGTASVPAGASTGEHEAWELRDGGKRYFGLGVQRAIRNIRQKILPLLQGLDCTRQREIDSLMIEADGTKNRSILGANAILAVSLACAKAAAAAQGMLLFQYLNTSPQIDHKPALPYAFFNIINGGKHADNSLSFQEFMVVPQYASFRKNLQAAAEVYYYLKQALHRRYGKSETNVGDEGGFAPATVKTAMEVLDLLQDAIRTAGHSKKVKIALDCAASEFYAQGKYSVDGKKLTTEQLLGYYLALIRQYPIISLEDPFHQEDFLAFSILRDESGIQVVGDDLTVTNPERITTAIAEDSCNCLLLKVNQIGTLTEALDAAKLAFADGWNVMVSHRSGETEDTFIADLVVALGCKQLKAGAPCRGERTAKYNRLLRIEEFLQKGLI